MEEDELVALIEGKGLLDFRAERAFKKIDTDKSGYLDKQEILAYMKNSTDGKIDEEHLAQDVQKWGNRVSHDNKVFDLADFKLIYRDMVRQELDKISISRSRISVNLQRGSFLPFANKSGIKSIKFQGILGDNLKPVKEESIIVDKSKHSGSDEESRR